MARCWAGFASLGAGLVHVAAFREHLDHWLPAGIFFAVTAFVQIGWGLAALARDRAPYPLTFIALNIGVVALWAVTRTTGLPTGPEAGAAEPVGTADGLCMVLQGLIVMSLLVAVGTARTAAPPGARTTDTGRPRPARFLVGLAAGAVVMSALATPAMAATEAGKYARSHGDHGESGDSPRR